MSNSSKVSAFLAYLLLVLGWLYVLLFRKGDKFAVFHTKQSIVLVLAAIVSFLTWAVVAWVITFIPYAGALAAAALFALVVLAYIGLLINWIIGMIWAAQGKTKALPITGKRADRLPF